MDRELVRVGQQKLIIASFSSLQGVSGYSSVKANVRTLGLACEGVTRANGGARNDVLNADGEDNFRASIYSIQQISLDM